VSIAPVPAERPAPPRRAPIRFSLPVSQPVEDRQQARDAEFHRLVAEIARLTQRDDRAPEGNG
jgi:hypothetical protein